MPSITLRSSGLPIVPSIISLFPSMRQRSKVGIVRILKDLVGFKERIRQLGIKKTDVSESIMRVRKQYPRHYETWSDEEYRILQEFMQKTNDLNLFCSCFQRTPGSIRIKVEGMNQN